ncbi:MAG: 3-deoxy-manno-octulosonate cytidylyltransferase [Candidatus Omnitrophota bacterium]
MTILGVIPARWASTRFPGKILADLNGKPMIQHVWERAVQASALDYVLIAVDDPDVRAACKGFGAETVMTSSDHVSGTDRIAEAVKDRSEDIIVNIQGDEPLIAPEVINALAAALKEDAVCPMATVIKQISDPAEALDPNIVKAVIDSAGYALYFSRQAIPFNREGRPFQELTVYKHLGLYAYRRTFLQQFFGLPVSLLEQTEKLEQLRVLESGQKIKTVKTDYESIGVDTPEDLQKAAGLLKKENHV